MRNFRTYVHLTAGGWLLVQNQATQGFAGAHFDADFTPYAPVIPMTFTAQADGSLLMDTPPTTRNDHWWPDSRGTYPANSVNGVFVIAEMRVDDPNAHVLIGMGGDWWRDAGAAYVEPVGTNNPEIGISSWIKLSTNYQYGYYTNLSRANLLADPPPPLIGAPTTPPPTSSAPTVSITTSPTSITSGQSSTLSWSSTNATSCTASGGWSGTKSTSGTQAVTPTTNTTYTLTCTGSGGSASGSATVTVTTTSGTAPTVTITANPASVPQGQSSTLTWSSTNATSCALSGGYTATVGTSGSQSVTPGTGNTSYFLTCTGTGGSVTQTVWVTWTAGGTTPPPTTSGPITVGDRIQVSSGPLTVRSTASPTGGVVGSIAAGQNGTVVSGPIINGGYTWWQINFDWTYPDGWVAQDFIVSIATNPYANCVSLSLDCAMWQASGIDTKVYPVGVPAGYSWYADGDQNWGVKPSPMTAATGWAHLYPQSGTTIVPATIYVRNFKTYGHRIGGGWQLIQDQNNSAHRVGGGNYVADQTGNSGYPLTITYGTGFVSFPAPASGRMDHWWIEPRGTYTANTLDGLFVIMEVRTDNPNASFILQTGGDWWQNANAAYPNNAQVGIGSWTKLTTNFQYGYFTNMPRSVLEADPPPPLIGAPTTPPPTSSAPTVSISASPTSIQSGQSSTLSWSSTNATSCTASGGWSGTKSTSGTQSISPTANTTYTLTCTGSGGSTSGSATVTVTTTSGTAPTVTFTANPASIPQGQSSTLTWSSTNATSCALSGGYTATVGTSGSQSVTPGTGNTSYFLTCTGTGGSVTQTVWVTWTAAATDTTAPSTPANLSASAVSSSQINLSWSASTDNVAVTGYQVFRNGVQVGTPSGTTYSDTGLSASTAYSYTVKAVDAAGNTSANSNTASATTLAATAAFGIGDRMVTTANLNVRASASANGTLLGNQSQGSLGTLVGGPTIADGYIWWNINYDTGVDGWSVQDYIAKTTPLPTANISASPASITAGDSSTLSWTSTNATSCTASDGWSGGKSASGSQSVSPTTNTTYTLTCTGAGGSAIGSATVTVTTTPPPTSSAPTVTLTANPASIPQGQSSTLTWSSTNATSCTASGGWNGTKSTSGSQSVTPGTSNTSYFLTCTGTGGSVTQTVWVTWTAATTDTTAPSTPTNLSASAVSSSQVNLSWSASTDNVGVTGYQVLRNGVQIATLSNTTYTDIGLSPSTAYSYTVRARDAAGNTSGNSNTASITTQTLIVPDSQAPTAPTNLSASSAGTSQINVSWSASSDNVGVTGYQVFRNGTQVGTQSDTSFTDIGLAASTAYSYYVRAVDAAGNFSANSNTASATTQAVVVSDTQVPSAPAGLTASAVSSSQINLSWSASTDNVGVSNYEVFRNGVQVGSLTGTTFTDIGLSPSTAYAYTVKAKDAAGNASGNSTAASASTQAAVVSDTQAPSAPANLAAVAAGNSQVNLSWTASTDETSLTGYQIFRNGVQVGVVSGTTFTDIGLSPSTAYSYYVRAVDASGNVSSDSSAVSATTQDAPAPAAAAPASTVTYYPSTYYQTTPASPIVSTTTVSVNVYPQQAASTGAYQPSFSVSGTSGIPGCPISSTYLFARNLTRGDKGEDVRCLQKFLNAKAYTIVSSGPGSPGNESDEFGSKTEEALIKFQKDNAVALNIIRSTGYFGDTTRSYINALVGTQNTVAVDSTSNADLTDAERAAKIAVLLEEVKRLQALLTTLLAPRAGGQTVQTTTTSYSGAFYRDLEINAEGEDVRALQRYLNGHGYPVSDSGSGSSGNESDFFGARTKGALAKFQAANGIPATGYFGPLTRARIELLAQ